MKIKAGQETTWAQFASKNSDIYGSGVIRYAERWAGLMELELEEGKKLEDIARATSSVADTEGISGFMYGAAVAVLARVWEHGEALRTWHNLKTQIGTEGEKANTSGGVLNPATIMVNS